MNVPHVTAPSAPAPPSPPVPAPPAADGAFAVRLADAIASHGPGVGAAAADTGGRPGGTVHGAAAVTLGSMLRAGGAARPAALVPGVGVRSARVAPSIATAGAGTGPFAGHARVVAPTVGRVSSDYGMRIHPILGDHRMHHGIDIAAPTGTPVRAITEGTVVAAGDRGGYGLTVDVDHGGGTVTRYAHLSAIDVGVGDRLAAGTTLGAVGSTGRSTGPHLHVEVRVDGAPVDPAGLW